MESLLYKIGNWVFFGASAVILAVITVFVKYVHITSKERKVLYALTFYLFFLDLVMVLLQIV